MLVRLATVAEDAAWDAVDECCQHAESVLDLCDTCRQAVEHERAEFVHEIENKPAPVEIAIQ